MFEISIYLQCLFFFIVVLCPLRFSIYSRNRRKLMNSPKKNEETLRLHCAKWKTRYGELLAIDTVQHFSHGDQQMRVSASNLSIMASVREVLNHRPWWQFNRQSSHWGGGGGGGGGWRVIFTVNWKFTRYSQNVIFWIIKRESYSTDYHPRKPTQHAMLQHWLSNNQSSSLRHLCRVTFDYGKRQIPVHVSSK